MNGWIGPDSLGVRWMMPCMIPQHNNYNYQVGKEGLISLLSAQSKGPSEWLILIFFLLRDCSLLCPVSL